MNQEPILKYEKYEHRRINKISSNLQHILLFALGIAIALIANLIGDNAYADIEIYYAELTFHSDVITDSSIFHAFAFVLRQNFLELIAVVLIIPISITIFSRSLISFILILKGFIFCRNAGALVHICSRGLSVEGSRHLILSSLIALSAAVFCNIIFIYLCSQARSFSEHLFRNKDDSELSLLVSREAATFAQTFLTVLGTVVIISIFKTFLLWIISLI